MTPDFQRASVKAYEILRDYGISKTPVFPLRIIENTPGVFVVSFTEASSFTGVKLTDIVGNQNQDAIAFAQPRNGGIQYIVAYNQRFPFDILQFALARELGHIALGHRGYTPEDVRHAEAVCFAQHLLCPRPLIQAITESDVTPTVETIGALTGCYGRFIAEMRHTPGVHVPAELNRAVRNQLSDYISCSLDYLSLINSEDDSPKANFGAFMNNYEE